MRDFLVRVASVATAMAAMPQWTRVDEQGATVWKNPQWCDILSVDAYTDLGMPPVMSADGLTLVTPGVAPTLASGKWFVVSVDRAVTVPTAAQPAIQAQSDRSVPMQLPAGIKGLSTMWAGMLAPIPG